MLIGIPMVDVVDGVDGRGIALQGLDCGVLIDLNERALAAAIWLVLHLYVDSRPIFIKIIILYNSENVYTIHIM